MVSLNDFLDVVFGPVYGYAQSHPKRTFWLGRFGSFRENMIIAPQVGIRYALHVGVVLRFCGEFNVLNCTAVVHQPFG